METLSPERRERPSPEQRERLSPKQREIRAREHRILDVARPLVRDGGLDAVRIDAVAEAIGVTRGTVYNHFGGREEIILALAARAVSRRLALFRFAADLSDRSRRRIAAVGIACEVYAETMADDFAVEHLIRHDSVWMRASDRRREQLAADEAACMATVGGVIGHAVAAGDLTLPRGHAVHDVLYGLWSLTYGGLAIAMTSPSLPAVGIRDPHAAIRRNCNAMLDGLGWRPLFDAADYGRWVRKIRPRLVGKAEEILRSPGESS